MADSTRGSGAAPVNSRLETDKGRTTIADTVVSKIAGMAAREISGVHDMGGAASRALGAIKDKLPVASGPSPSQGVTVAVSDTDATIDLDVIVDYGVAIADVAQGIRQNVVAQVERMTGLQVTRVDIAVNDVWLGDDGDDGGQGDGSRSR